MEQIREKLDNQGNIIEVVLIKEQKIPVDLLPKYGYLYMYGTGFITKIDKVDELKNKCLDNGVIY